MSPTGCLTMIVSIGGVLAAADPVNRCTPD